MEFNGKTMTAFATFGSTGGAETASVLTVVLTENDTIANCSAEEIYNHARQGGIVLLSHNFAYIPLAYAGEEYADFELYAPTTKTKTVYRIDDAFTVSVYEQTIGEGGSGSADEVKSLLLQLFKNAVYSSDVHGAIDALTECFTHKEKAAFDLVEGNITQGSSYIKYWYSSPKRILTNPVLIQCDPEKQYIVSYNGIGTNYMLNVRAYNFTPAATYDYIVDGTKDVVYSGTPEYLGGQELTNGGSCVIPDCDAFAILINRVDGAEMTEADFGEIRNGLTVEVKNL